MDYIYIFRIIMDCIYIYQLKTKTSFKFPNVFFVFFAKKKPRQNWTRFSALPATARWKISTLEHATWTWQLGTYPRPPTVHQVVSQYRWRGQRRHDKPGLMGVAPPILSRWHIPFSEIRPYKGLLTHWPLISREKKPAIKSLFLRRVLFKEA